MVRDPNDPVVEDMTKDVEEKEVDGGPFDYVDSNGKKAPLKSSKLEALLKELEATRQKDKLKKSVIFSQFTMVRIKFEVF
jgi:hypothetical protein